jgi:glycosyltransferase involved in cell wall biosynthesis
MGKSRMIPSPEYETVLGAVDYCRKVTRFSLRGFVLHAHVNGSSPKGFVLTLMAQFLNLLSMRRSVLTFHAGLDQVYFPLPKGRLLIPVYWLMFALPRTIICNSEAVKVRIQDYGVPASKIVAIPAFSRQYLEFTPRELPPAVEDFYGRFPHVVFTYIRIRHGFYLDVLLDGFAQVAAARPDVGLVFCGVAGDIDPTLMAMVNEKVSSPALVGRVCVVDDLDHDEFLTAMTRSRLYLRTPTSDGVASSVLEALALRVPVVASENGTRPDGCVNYGASSPDDLAAKTLQVLANHDQVVASLPQVVIVDTLSTEIAVLEGSR